MAVAAFETGEMRTPARMTPQRWTFAEEKRPDSTVFAASGKTILQRLAHSVTPSFLHRRLHGSSKQRLHPTSYLDGLRGVASFIVFMGHYTEENVGWWTEPYGLYEDGARSSPLQLPFVRVLYSPRPMVHIFFIISGFVLAYKPIKQIHAQQYASLASTLSSSVFRRAVRLFLPSFITILMMAMAVYQGWSSTRYMHAYTNLTDQLGSVWDTCWTLLKNIWTWNNAPTPRYNPALWTIPVEFAQSMILFLVTLGLSHCTINVRLILLAGIISFCFYSAELHAVEFIGGMFLAEVTLLQSPSSISIPDVILPVSKEAEDFQQDEECSKLCASRTKEIIAQAFWVTNVVSGLFIASWTNNHTSEVWGIRTLDAHTPEPYAGQRVWFCLGAFQIVIACTQMPLLQAIFNTPVAQYLGNISYALYLMHNLCLTILEPIFSPAFDYYLGKATFWGRHTSWAMGLLLYVPVIIWVSDVFWRAVDVPTVKFARWLESKCLVQVSKKSAIADRAQD